MGDKAAIGPTASHNETRNKAHTSSTQTGLSASKSSLDQMCSQCESEGRLTLLSKEEERKTNSYATSGSISWLHPGLLPQKIPCVSSHTD